MSGNGNQSVTFLALVDNLDLQERVQLGDFVVRRFSKVELAAKLRGNEDLPLKEGERDEFEQRAMFPWVQHQFPLSKFENPLRPNPPHNISAFDSALHNFRYRYAGAETAWPFDSFFTTLNLLKQSNGPVIPCHVYLCPLVLQTRYQVESMTLRHAMIDSDSEELERPRLFGFRLDASDVHGFVELRAKLEQCLAKNPGDSQPDNTHLRIAAHFFAHGDKRIAPCRFNFGLIDPLLAYEAALEALLLREVEPLKKQAKKQGDASLLSHRVASIPLLKHPSTEDFIRLVHWIRSKIAHGVKPIREIERVIRCPDKGLPKDARLISGLPPGPYSRLYLSGGDFEGLVVNLREVARRCIRFFFDEYFAGRGRDSTLDRLDSESRQ